MTLYQLHKRLGFLLEKNPNMKRAPVVVSKLTFTHPLEADGVTLLEVHDAFLQCHTVSDGDGFSVVNKDGTERIQSMCVITGEKS